MKNSQEENEDADRYTKAIFCGRPTLWQSLNHLLC